MVKREVPEFVSKEIMDNRTNSQWLSDLRTPGPQQESALADLRAIILKGLPFALSKWLSRDDPKFDRA